MGESLPIYSFNVSSGKQNIFMEPDARSRNWGVSHSKLLANRLRDTPQSLTSASGLKHGGIK